MKTIRFIICQLSLSHFLYIFISLSLSMSIVFTHPATAAAPEYGGRITLAGETEGLGFDAIKTRSLMGSTRAMSRLVMERLFDRGENGELLPVLGLSADQSEDGKIWTITLRQGVKFHDGTPFNADAVVLHWNRLLNPKNRFRGLLLLRPVESVEKTGEFEVRFRLKHPWAPFTAFITNPTGFSSLIPSPTAVKNDTQNLSPVGTGPFIFKEWKRGSHMRVVKNPGYWQKGKPYLDEIIYKPILDHGARYAALASGQADIMITDRPVHVKKLENNPEFSKHLMVFRGAGIFVLNTKKPPLDDVRVRRALALAWDQEKYLAISFKNIMPFTQHWFGDAVGCADVGYPSHDIQEASQLISAYGKHVELEYVHTATNRGKEAGIIVQQMMKQINVKINPVPSDFPGIVKRLISKQYDMSSWVIPGNMDMGPITTAILHSKSPWNVSGYSDPEMDKLLVELKMATAPEQREELMCRIARKANSEVPFIFIFGRTYHLFYKNHIKNLNLPKHGEEGLKLVNAWVAPAM